MANATLTSTAPFDTALRHRPSTPLRTGSGQAQDRLRTGSVQVAIRSQESGVIYFGFWILDFGFWIVFVNSNLKSKI
ncbi:hypothetical protein [Sphaerospermopsis sp. FACHB-1194]|uniref:hypothetical protein n=1 Tax=Sphaerospermopsis sp. FACHB-1194 TaxID=2692862 RepID=UPI00168088CA|nr:hypothetical protein [Sphaerospermopsis sp. FACHB-1194]MBD2147338.1 hypothetical protein [Sphaerospermopsis sp. FACHB-1194]